MVDMSEYKNNCLLDQCRTASKEHWDNVNKAKQAFFWSKVEVLDTRYCWKWQSTKSKGGYGTFSIHNRAHSAHRAAYEFVFGPIPKGMFVCHKCDVKLCVNPFHLFIGTPKDNAQDCIQKGRKATFPGSKNGMWGRRGEKSPCSILDDLKVIQIRKDYANGARQTDLANKYGVTQVNISAIVTRKTWSHI